MAKEVRRDGSSLMWVVKGCGFRGLKQSSPPACTPKHRAGLSAMGQRTLPTPEAVSLLSL